MLKTKLRSIDPSEFNQVTELSVITASLNSSQTIEDTIKSVSTQTCLPKHIVVDGGSADSTREIIAKYAQHFSRSISEKDEGIYDALNKGILEASEGIVGILHADDMFADENVVEAVLEAFASSPVDAVYGDLVFVDRVDPEKIIRLWRAGEFKPRNFYHGWMPPHPTFFVRRQCYEKFGLYRLDLGTAADYELMLRFLVVNRIRVQYIPRVLVKMRVGGISNSSLGARVRANRMDRKAWKVNGLKPHPWTLIAKPLRKAGQWWVR